MGIFLYVVWSGIIVGINLTDSRSHGKWEMGVILIIQSEVGKTYPLWVTPVSKYDHELYKDEGAR